MTNFDVFLQTLPIMGYGMAGIFIVMVLIMISIKVLNKVSGRKKKTE